VLINRSEAASALAALREFFELRHKRIVVVGGDEVPLVTSDYDWNGVVLAPTLTQEIRDDFERFLRSRAWFRKQRLSYRRSYLLHGPPGNGKTSVTRIMASHPAISAFTLNFSMPELGDRDVSELFAAAARASPALVIIEDLDRLFGREGQIDRRDQEADNRTAITLPHLLNCLDGLYSGEGVIVVATAN
jgi:chaperone BCS1